MTTDGRKLRAQALREERRAEILRAARSVFADQGYHAASITALIKAAGVARGTFYLYFDSKQSVFLAMLDALMTRLRGSVVGVDITAGRKAMRTQLVGTIERLLHTAQDEGDVVRLIFHQGIGLEAPIQEALEAFEDNLLGYLQASLQMGTELGWLRPHDHHVAAVSIYGSMRYLVDRLTSDRLAPIEEREDLAEEVVSLHLDGLLPRPA